MEDWTSNLLHVRHMSSHGTAVPLLSALSQHPLSNANTPTYNNYSRKKVSGQLTKAWWEDSSSQRSVSWPQNDSCRAGCASYPRPGHTTDWFEVDGCSLSKCEQPTRTVLCRAIAKGGKKSLTDTFNCESLTILKCENAKNRSHLDISYWSLFLVSPPWQSDLTMRRKLSCPSLADFLLPPPAIVMLHQG